MQSTVLQPGQILQERYQLQQPLGRTAAGRQTWLAVDTQSPIREQVAVKLLAFSPYLQWDELKLFEREAQVLKALKHPQIPRYRDYFALDQQIGAGLPWFALVQDYISGETLQVLLERGQRFTAPEVRQIAVQLLHILSYLHELSPPVLHRDIKPSNLILGADQQVYLVDFGAVQDRAAVTGITFTVVGTCGYAPLEQFWGRAVPASDLYALGATLIHLLTGVNPADLPQRDNRIQFSDRVSLDPSLVRWIEQLTEPAIEKRFGSAHQALAVLVSGEGNYRNATARKILPPTDSRVQIQRSVDRLEILIPAYSQRKLEKFRFGFWFWLMIGLALIPGLTLPVLVGFLIWLFNGLGGRMQIVFDLHQFKLQRQIFGVTYSQQTGEISEILGVFLHSDRHARDSTQVVIRSDHKRYPLKGALSEHECAWIAQEIQTWLY